MTARRRLGPAELDRACGAVLGSAFGDALGAGYEFAAPPGPAEPVVMRPGTLTGSPPGYWTDDTEMACCVLGAAAAGDLTSPSALDAVAASFADWFEQEPADMGLATVGALGSGARDAAGLRAGARRYVERTGRGGGNGSLMRTHPVPLAYLDRPAGGELDGLLRVAARAVSELTHADPYTADACVLWSFAVDRTIRSGSFGGILDGLDHVPCDRRRFWEHHLADAFTGDPSRFSPNGYVVTALCAALAAVASTAHVDGPEHLAESVAAAVRIGDDTDTVAAIAGALAGARWGASAVPATHRRVLRGWPGLDAGAMVRVAATAALGGNDGSGWPGAEDLSEFYGARWCSAPFQVALPADPGVVLGNVFALASVDTDAVVSLCRVGRNQLRGEHLEVWLVDSPDATANPNLDFVLADTADAVAELRAEGSTVFVHCVEGRSRTPAVAAAYLVRHLGFTPDAAVAALAGVLPRCEPNAAFVAALERLAAPAVQRPSTAPSSVAAST